MSLRSPAHWRARPSTSASLQSTVESYLQIFWFILIHVLFNQMNFFLNFYTLLSLFDVFLALNYLISTPWKEVLDGQGDFRNHQKANFFQL